MRSMGNFQGVKLPQENLSGATEPLGKNQRVIRPDIGKNIIKASDEKLNRK